MKRMEELGLHDIYGIWHIPFWQTQTFYFIITSIVVAFVSLMLWLIVKKYRARKKHSSIPVWQKALTRIKILQQQSCETKEDGKKIYFVLTTIIKDYLYERYSLDVISKTDDEMIIHLRKNSFPNDLLKNIESIVDGCIFIKFANAQAMRDQIKQHIDLTVTLVKHTIPSNEKI